MSQYTLISVEGFTVADQWVGIVRLDYLAYLACLFLWPAYFFEGNNASRYVFSSISRSISVCEDSWHVVGDGVVDADVHHGASHLGKIALLSVT